MLRELLKERGWTQDELALITGRSVKAINDLVRGRSGISPEMAACLAAAFGNSPEQWMQAETTYRLSLISEDTSDIERRARLFSIAPIRDMQRRGWIKETDNLGELEAEVASFFSDPYAAVSPVEITTRPFFVAARRTIAVPNLTPAETAWCFRARQLASTSPANPFREDKLSKTKSALRRLAAHPKEARHLSTVLGEFGIRFVVVEPLPEVRIDGAAFWDEIGPVIAVSIRHDRVDGFWFTIMHEFSHVRHGDKISVDTGMVDAVTGVSVELAGNEAEDRANREASSSLVPIEEIESFISRVGPLYPRQRIIQFANRIHIHPGIIVGQLQHRGEIGYASMRDLLPKVREYVVSTALTDGWGQAISPLVARRSR